MAYREVTRVEIQDIIRRWQAGDSRRKIALGTGLSRDTIAKYIAAAQGAGNVSIAGVENCFMTNRLYLPVGLESAVALAESIIEPIERCRPHS